MVKKSENPKKSQKISKIHFFWIKKKQKKKHFFAKKKNIKKIKNAILLVF